MKPEARIAFVTDALPSLGGGERVLFAALEAFPKAELFTLVYNKNAFTSTPLEERRVNTSFLDRIPMAHTHHRLFLPLMPLAIESFDLREYDIVVSFSYAVAHGARHRDDARHISYTYTPMRYAWTNLNLDGTPSRKNPLLNGFLRWFRTWDKDAASRVHEFAAISQAVSQRIAYAYQRRASIIYPPVEVERFKPSPKRENFYITVTRLVPHKRVDLLVQAFTQLKLPLLIVGEGPQLPHLKSMAGPNVQFLGFQTDEKVAELLGKARGFVCATAEDFGIAIVEAQAAGCPVIAYGGGGALETVIDGVTGFFFPEQTSESLTTTLLRFERERTRFHIPDLLRNAQRFNKSRFVTAFGEFVRQPSTIVS